MLDVIEYAMQVVLVGGSIIYIVLLSILALYAFITVIKNNRDIDNE